jgi:Cu(I)/Ag(I) efflux system membrane fusion protein
MTFRKPDPKAFPDVKAGDTVHFEFARTGDGYVLASVHRLGAAQ